MEIAENFKQVTVVVVKDTEIIIGLKEDGTVWRKVMAPYLQEWEQI